MAWDWEKLKEQQQRQGGHQPPPVDELLNKFKGMKPSGGLFLILPVIGVFLVFWISTMFYMIETGEVGVIQRFGAFIRYENPGLNVKLPAGIEKVTKVKQERIYKEEFGFEPEYSDKYNRYSSDDATKSESLMLTGDLFVAVVPWVVQFKIKEPKDFLFKVDGPQKLLRDMSEAVMRLVVGDRSINEVITKRQEIADEFKVKLQNELDLAETGIQIVTVGMKKTNVPGPVQPSFNEVNQAVQEKEKMIYQAREDYNKAIPAARGEAERTIRGAEGYADERINRAKGDAERFTTVYKEYTKAKDVTKRRLYLETLKELFPKLGHKYILDQDQSNLLPLLNLGNQEGASK